MRVINWTFGDRVRKIRRTVGMSSRDFAAALGVTNSALAQWETDRSLPRDPALVAAQVEELTGVAAGWLVSGGCPEAGPADSPVQDS